MPFGFLADFHANQGVGARYQSRDRIWRGVAQAPGSGPGPLPANNTAVFLDVYVWRHLLALSRLRAETTNSGPDYFVRYFRSRFRPHLHSYFSSQNVPSVALEEVKVDFANGNETFQTAANFRVDYLVTIAALLSELTWLYAW